MDKKYDIGVVGLWYGQNYGSILTYYSLKTVLESFGHSVVMVERPLGRNHPEIQENTHARIFAKSHFKITDYKSVKDLKDLNDVCDCFVLGSDQIFNPGIYKNYRNTFFLDFADNTKRKIACAASFGHSNFKFSFFEKLKVSYYLNKFDAISVREKSGVEILKNRLGIKDAKHILDPIFMSDVSLYNGLIDEIPENKESNYVLSYILDPTPEKKKLIMNASQKLDKKYFNILDGFANKYDNNYKLMDSDNTLPPLNVHEVLSYYKNADFIITDSFHGTCLAILFNKPFVSLVNKRRGVTRFESMLDEFGLLDRLFYEIDDSILDTVSKDIDYERVEKILNEKRKEALEWLSDALNKPLKNKEDNFIQKIIGWYFSTDIHKTLIYYKYKVFRMFSFTKRKQEHYDNKLNDLYKELQIMKQ